MIYTVDLIKNQGAPPHVLLWLESEYSQNSFDIEEAITTMIRKNAVPYKVPSSEIFWLADYCSDFQFTSNFSWIDKWNEIFQNENSQKCYRSGLVKNSTNITNSWNVKDSKEVQESFEIANSLYISQSNNIVNSKNVIKSSIISNSEKCINSFDIEKSSNIAFSSSIINSNSIYNGKYIYQSKGIINSQNLTECYGCTQCNNITNALFCFNLTDQTDNYFIFNQPQSKQVFELAVARFNTFFNELNLYDPAQLNSLDLFSIYSNQNPTFWNWVKNLPGYSPILLYQITLLPETIQSSTT